MDAKIARRFRPNLTASDLNNLIGMSTSPTVPCCPRRTALTLQRQGLVQATEGTDNHFELTPLGASVLDMWGRAGHLQFRELRDETDKLRRIVIENGLGDSSSHAPKKNFCENCGGKGWLPVVAGNGIRAGTCSICKGTGKRQ